MRSKRLIMALIVTIMMISAVACGNADKAEESKTTDETTKEVITASTENITQSVTELTTKKKEEETDSHGHWLRNEGTFEFLYTSELSEETCKNIAEFFKDKTIKPGDIVDLSQIQYKSEEYDCMQSFGFVMIDFIPHNWNSSDYLAPFKYDWDYTIEIEILYNSEGIKIRKFSFSS